MKLSTVHHKESRACDGRCNDVYLIADFLVMSVAICAVATTWVPCHSKLVQLLEKAGRSMTCPILSNHIRYAHMDWTVVASCW